MINEQLAERIDQETGIEEVEIRSVLTCEMPKGVCVKCYGRNLAYNRVAQVGDAVGIIAAQSIGEPGTQLTLRTFHVGGTASNVASESQLTAKFDGIIEFDAVRTVIHINEEGKRKETVLGRTGEIRIIDPKTGRQLVSNNAPYGAEIFIKDKQTIKKGDLICEWDPYNAVIVSEFAGQVLFENIIEGITFREEADEQTGFKEKVIIETRDKTKIPSIKVTDLSGEILRSYNVPVGSHINVEEGDMLFKGQVLVKIPRILGKVRDITGGLPRVTELFEARNPSNPAVVSEIDGAVSFGKIKRGNREILITSKDGQRRKYMVPLSKHILVQENDFVRAGTPLSDGAITPADILNIKGTFAVQEYIVNEVQEVYRLQGVKINDKHIEVIVRQMMRKVQVLDPGDTRFMERMPVEKYQFMQENDRIYDKRIVVEAGDSKKLRVGQMVSLRELREENSYLRRNDLSLVEDRPAISATSKPMLQGITKASLGTDSWISAASFQETTKVLSKASIAAKVDFLNGLKENVIVGHLIPAGTGRKEFRNLVVGNKEELERMESKKRRDREYVDKY